MGIAEILMSVGNKKTTLQMKRELTFLLVTFIFLTANCQEKKYKVEDIPLMNEWHDVNFYHVTYTNFKKNVGDTIHAGEQIGEIQKDPESFSDYYNEEIIQSISFYIQKEYQKAIDVLKIAFEKEPDNLFILNNYARASYWTNIEESYKVYQKIINRLDSIYKEPGYMVSVDMWFREAYWKLGTLYLDYYKYDKAYYEISRSLAAMQDLKGEYIYCQALEYLTECAFMMKEDELTLHLANRTLHYDPKNEYATKILKEIKQHVKKK